MEIRVLPYAHPDVGLLVSALQQEYVVRYGDTDKTPVDPAAFAPPRGHFLVGYDEGRPVGCGGWRTHDGSDPGLLPGDAEIKRMYVVPTARGRGLSRALLAELERTAHAAGIRRLVLETGTQQPEAIGLYASSGYQPIPGFGIHRHLPLSRCFGKPLEVLAGGPQLDPKS